MSLKASIEHMIYYPVHCSHMHSTLLASVLSTLFAVSMHSSAST